MQQNIDLTVKRILIQIFCLIFTSFILSPWLPDLLKKDFLSRGNWNPSLSLSSSPMPLIYLTVFVCLIISAASFFKSLKLISIKEFLYPILFQFVLLGLLVYLLIGTIKVISRGQQIFDLRVENILTKIRTGMPKKEIESTLIAANLSLLGAKGEILSDIMSKTEKNDFKLAQKAIKNISTAKKIDIAPFSFENTLFSLKYENLKQTYKRRYFHASDNFTSYELIAEYNKDDKLKSASYLKSEFIEDHSECMVLMEIPPGKGKPYPYPCRISPSK